MANAAPPGDAPSGEPTAEPAFVEAASAEPPLVEPPEPGDLVDRDGLHTGLGFASAGFAVTGIIGIATSVLMARLFGITVVGQNAIALVPGGVLLLLSSVREKPGAIQILSRLAPRSDGVLGLFVPLLVFSTVLTSVVAIIVGVVAWQLFDHTSRQDLLGAALVYVATITLLVNTSSNFDVVYSSYGDARTIFYARVSEAASYAVLLVFAAIVWPTVGGVVFAASASWVVGLVVRVARVGRWMSRATNTQSLRSGTRQMAGVIAFGLRLLPGFLADGVANQVGIWVIAGNGTVRDVGAYSRAQSLSGRLVEASARFSEVMQQSLMHASDQGADELASRYAVGSRLSWVVMLALVTTLWAVAPGVMAIFGPGFQAGATALALLGVYAAAGVGTAAQNDVLVAINRPKIISAISGVALVVTIAATIPLTIAWGASGAAAGLLVGSAARLAVNAWFLSVQAGVHATRYWSIPSRVGAAAAVAALAGGGRYAYDLAPSLLTTIVVGVIVGSAFLLSTPLTGMLASDEQARLGQRLRRKTPSA